MKKYNGGQRNFSKKYLYILQAIKPIKMMTITKNSSIGSENISTNTSNAKVVPQNYVNS